MRDLTEEERQHRAETLDAMERHALTAQEEIDALVQLVNEERERQGIVLDGGVVQRSSEFS